MKFESKQTRWKEDNHSKGLCVICGAQAEPGVRALWSRHCTKHKLMHRKWAREWKQRQKTKDD